MAQTVSRRHHGSDRRRTTSARVPQCDDLDNILPDLVVDEVADMTQRDTSHSSTSRTDRRLACVRKLGDLQERSRDVFGESIGCSGPILVPPVRRLVDLTLCEWANYDV